MSALRLFGVAALRGLDGTGVSADASVIAYGRLGAVVRQSAYAPVEATDEAMELHQRVVQGVFERTPIVPVPFGTVFRSPDRVRRWLEVNYIALSEGIHFVDGRCEARVHLAERERPDGPPHGARRRADLTVIANEIFRLLRRHSVAALPLRTDGEVLNGAFLVGREEWEAFTEQIGEQGRRNTELRLDQTGPWVPYDFVRMELGA